MLCMILSLNSKSVISVTVIKQLSVNIKTQLNEVIIMLDAALELVYFILVCISVVVMASPLALVMTAWEEVNELVNIDFDVKGLDL